MGGNERPLLAMPFKHVPLGQLEDDLTAATAHKGRFLRG